MTTGSLVLYDENAAVLERYEVALGVWQYQFEQTIEANRPYYVKLHVVEGRADYTTALTLGSDEPPGVECDPPCDPAQSQCNQNTGQCELICDPVCTGRERCNLETQECERPLLSCTGSRPSNHICNRRTGEWKPRRQASEADCQPSCTPGELCVEGACVPSNPPEAEPELIRGIVINYWLQHDHNRVMLYVNRGSRHGVTRGASATVCNGQTAMVRSVGEYKSTLATSAYTGACNTVTIKP